MNPFLLLASFDSAFSYGLGIVAKIAFGIAIILVISAGWAWRSGRPDEAKSTLLGAVIIALAFVIASALFNAGGLPTVNIGR
jgi:uncharacterized BrkB/YihY/UPF0761 family membrane protein